MVDGKPHRRTGLWELGVFAAMELLDPMIGIYMFALEKNGSVIIFPEYHLQQLQKVIVLLIYKF